MATLATVPRLVTRHASANMAARGISPADLDRILAQGRARESRTVPGRYIVQAGRDSVVIVADPDRIVILTAIRDGMPGA